jgi:hypothetical protein
MKHILNPSLRHEEIIAEAVQGYPPGYSLCPVLHFSSDSSELDSGKVLKVHRNNTPHISPADRHAAMNSEVRPPDVALPP